MYNQYTFSPFPTYTTILHTHIHIHTLTHCTYIEPISTNVESIPIPSRHSPALWLDSSQYKSKTYEHWMSKEKNIILEMSYCTDIRRCLQGIRKFRNPNYSYYVVRWGIRIWNNWRTQYFQHHVLTEFNWLQLGKVRGWQHTGLGLVLADTGINE